MVKIALCQTHNSYESAENRKSVLRCLEEAAKAGAHLAFFPECAASGFNRGLLNIDGDALMETQKAVGAFAAQAQMQVLLPTPTPLPGGGFLNSVIRFDAQGMGQGTFSKVGFQRGEEKLFVPAAPHDRTFEMNGIRIGVLICIEASRGPWDFLPKENPPQVILWPGFYGTKKFHTWSDGVDDETLQIKANLKEWKAPVLQATCASSPESGHWPDRFFGGSIVLSETGKVVHTCDLEKEQVAIVTVTADGVRGVEAR